MKVKKKQIKKVTGQGLGVFIDVKKEKKLPVQKLPYAFLTPTHIYIYSN